MNTFYSHPKEALLEAALRGEPSRDLAAHLENCPACRSALSEWKLRNARLESLLPLLARQTAPSPAFRAKVLAVAAQPARHRVWFLRPAFLAVCVVSVVTLGGAAYRVWRSHNVDPDFDLQAVRQLTEWRAPSDVFLKTPGQELLRSAPRIGDSCVKIPVSLKEEN